MSNPSLRAILLDIDGTLLDSNAAHTDAWVESLRRHGHTIAFERVRPLIGKGGDKVLQELLGLDEDDDEAKSISHDRGEIFLRDLLPSLQPTPGARALLQRLKGDGRQLVVATSATDKELTALLKRAGIADLVDATTTSDEADASKPDPDIVQAALGKAGVSAAEAVMLGDTPYDVQAARAAGVDAIALRCGGWWDDGALDGAVAVYDDPADLLARLPGSPLCA